MLEDLEPSKITEMPGQRPSNPATPAEARGRFFNSGNAFNMRLSPVPPTSFTAEPLRAFDPATPTGFIACDISDELGVACAATAPLLLVRYAKIRAGETLSADFVASGVIVYVMQGSGSTECAQETVMWGAGDLLVLPGGEPAMHVAGKTDCVFWIVTNEPQLAFESVRAPAPGQAPTRLVHYRAQEIARQLDHVYAVADDDRLPGAALVFSAEEQETTHNILPTMTLALNSLSAGRVQRAHRHNSVALTLVLQGARCFSLIDGERMDWSDRATLITPPGALHSHHNEGRERALFLIVQDGGLYYHARTMGFSFDE